jgi:hypothetical protein
MTTLQPQIIIVIASSIAAFLATLWAYVKLISDKEQKTTEFRQQWTVSFRSAIAELIAEIRLSSNLAAEFHKTNQPNAVEELLNAKLALMHESRAKVMNAHSLIRLHFKPQDAHYEAIDKKINAAVELLNEKNHEDTVSSKIRVELSEITELSRGILKHEWERIKQGEQAYRATQWVMLLAIVSLPIGLLFVLLGL